MSRKLSLTNRSAYTLIELLAAEPGIGVPEASLGASASPAARAGAPGAEAGARRDRRVRALKGRPGSSHRRSTATSQRTVAAPCQNRRLVAPSLVLSPALAGRCWGRSAAVPPSHRVTISRE